MRNENKSLLHQMDERANKVLRDLFDETMTKVCDEMIKKSRKKRGKHDKK